MVGNCHQFLAESDVISFSSKDAEGVSFPHNDTLVVDMAARNCIIHRVLVDDGSSMNLMTKDLFQKLNLNQRKHLRPLLSPIVGIAGKPLTPLGVVSLQVSLGSAPCKKEVDTDFLVVDFEFPYNAIIGRPLLTTIKAAVCVPYLVMKFPTPNGVGVVRGNQLTARRCYVIHTVAITESLPLLPVEALDSRGIAPVGEPASQLESLILDRKQPDHTVQISKDMAPNVKDNVSAVLKKYATSFAWSPKELTGVSPDLVQHCLNVNPQGKPIKQRPRKYSVDQTRAIEDEVEKLLEAGVIREILYPEWLANVVMVKKKNGKWRMCVDFTNLNKACPPAPRTAILSHILIA